MDTNGSSLFIVNDSDSEDEYSTSPKRRKVMPEDTLATSKSSILDLIRSDDSTSDSEFSDYEDVPLGAVNEPVAESFSIPIETTDQAVRKRKLDSIKNRKRKVAIHFLGMVSYMLHAHNRNKILTDKKVLRSVKKTLPDSFLSGPFKKYKKLKNSDSPDRLELDTLFIYVVKYLIKWFRFNFKFDSNGIRVLGYLSTEELPNIKDYYPGAAPPIRDRKDMLQVIKRFKHNRDSAAQVFTALMRSLGFESRLVFSLPILPISGNPKPQPKVDHSKLGANKDNDLLLPYFWTEIINPADPGEVLILEASCFHDEDKRVTRLRRFYDSGPVQNYYTQNFYSESSRFNQITMHYVIALDDQHTMLDVSSRYMSDVSYRWFNKLDLRTDYGRTALLFQTLLRLFNKNVSYSSQINSELECLRKVAMKTYTVPEKIAGMKRNPNLVTELNLRYNESIAPNTKPIKFMHVKRKNVAVFFRNSIIVAKSENQWKFLGRSIISSEIDKPIKTTNTIMKRTIGNRRIHNMNILNNEPELNETALYSFQQTCQYIKMKISKVGENVVLPKNKYGNIEIYRKSMIPDGCCWLQLSDIDQILSEHNLKIKENGALPLIGYVPVVVGFSFTSMPVMAIPLKRGVLVHTSDETLVKQIWIQGKIDARRKKLDIALSEWSRFLKSVKIKTRLDEQYGDV